MLTILFWVTPNSYINVNIIIYIICIKYTLYTYYTCGKWKFLSQGSNTSCSYDLHHRCGNTRPLTHCAGWWSNLCLSRNPSHVRDNARSFTCCNTVGIPSFNFNCLFKDLISTYSHILSSWWLGLQHMSWIASQSNIEWDL